MNEADESGGGLAGASVRPTGRARPSAVEALAGFDGPPQAFLNHLIALQGAMVGADQGVILGFGSTAGIQLVSSYNPQHDQLPPSWAQAAAKHAPKVFGEPGAVLVGWRGPESEFGWLVLLALPASRSLGPADGLMSALCLSGDDRASAERCARELGATVAIVKAYEARWEAGQRQGGIDRLTESIDLLAAVGLCQRFREAAMSLCNELASRYHAHRVSLGWVAGGGRSGGPGGLKLVALSRTERVNRRMKLVQDLEAAMEETRDQDTEVIWPSPPEVPVVARDHAVVAAGHGSSHVLSLPLRSSDDRPAGATRRGRPVVGVLVIEWTALPDRSETAPPADAAVRSRLLADLITPLLKQLHDRDRWAVVKLRDRAGRWAGAVVGSEYTWAKLAAVALLAAVLWLTLGRGTDHIESTFVVEAAERQLIAAPFAGYLDAVYVEPGDRVEAGQTVLAGLDASEMRLEAARLSAEGAAFRRQAEQARGERDMAGVQVALAEAEATAAQHALILSQIEQSSLRSPLSGVVIQGDLKRQLGVAVTEGQTLFEVAPLTALRAELQVPEDRAGEVSAGMRGELATAAHPDQRVSFTVDRIEPAARVENGRNVFGVEVRLDDQPPWLRPGMTGAARVRVGEDRHVVLWTRDAINWLRMKLWL